MAMDKEDAINVKEISAFVARTLIEKDNARMGIKIIQLISGEDIAVEKSVLNPIQSKLYEFAAHMKNIIHIIVDIKTKNCILIDAVRALHVAVWAQGEKVLIHVVVLGY